MSFSGLLDVAISFIFFYLVLSLICTTINEFIATTFKLRAKWLASALVGLIDELELRSRFLAHGLIANDTNASKGKAVASSAGKKETASYIDSRTFAMALLGSLDPDKPMPVIGDIQTAVGNLPSGGIKDVLRAHLAMAAGDIDKLRTGIAEWFDAAMDRLGGSYKRWLKWISLVTGIVLAIALNADSFAVGTAVWKDEALRNQIVSDAAEIVKADSPSTVKCGDKTDPGEKLRCQLDLLRPFPIGWTEENSADKHGGWLVKILGCLLTGLALSLGAPFWFDTLTKFMNVRGAGVKPKKEEEKVK